MDKTARKHCKRYEKVRLSSAKLVERLAIMDNTAVDLIANRINQLMMDRKAIDIAITELQNVLKTLGGNPSVHAKSLDELWGQDSANMSAASPAETGKTADGKAPEVVASPKTGTPVASPTATLKARLRGNGLK